MSNSFDTRANTWDEDPRRLQLAANIFSALEKQVSLQTHFTALDYGCGTGLLTLALAPHVRHIVAIDSSKGMLDVLTRKIQTIDIRNVEPLLADFSKDPLPHRFFDLVASAMTLHHVPDIPAILRQFFSLLSPGGHLALADLDTEDGTFHGPNATIPHFGFDRDTLAHQLAAAGFEEIQFSTATRVEKNSRAYSIFLLTAQKPQ